MCVSFFSTLELPASFQSNGVKRIAVDRGPDGPKSGDKCSVNPPLRYLSYLSELIETTLPVIYQPGIGNRNPICRVHFSSPSFSGHPLNAPVQISHIFIRYGVLDSLKNFPIKSHSQ